MARVGDLPPSSVTFFEANLEGMRPEGNSPNRFMTSTLTEGEDWLPANHDPLEEVSEQDPLTAEMIISDFSHAVSLETGNMLLTTVPGEKEFDKALQTAGDEIVAHYLWRMGLPSELSKFLDINMPVTRSFLQEEYANIPENVDRDNSPNSFRKRWEHVKEHLSNQQVSIDEQNDAIDVWRGDLQVRLEITATKNETEEQPAPDPLEQFRPGYKREQKIGQAVVDASWHR